MFLFACASVPQFELSNNKNSKIDSAPINDAPIDDLMSPERDFLDPDPEFELENEVEVPATAPEMPPVVVCDPLTDGSVSGMAQAKNGLIGKLSYLLPGEPIANSVFDFWLLNSMTAEVEAVRGIEYDLISSQINVPTRSFDKGFIPQGLESEPLKTSTGEILVENFGIYYQSNLVLGEALPGRYEIATLSDDGSFLELFGALPNGESFVLNNDGNHPTRMRCSAQVVEINESSQFPLELFYHQGPRFHISLILMWRKLADNQEAGRDSLCGASGNSLFFDFSQTPSVPRQPYLDLLARGWEVIPSTSFVLPNDQMNPCVDE